MHPKLSSPIAPWPQAPSRRETITLTPPIFWKPEDGLLPFPAVPLGTHLGGVVGEKVISSETLTWSQNKRGPDRESTARRGFIFPEGQEGSCSSLNSKKTKHMLKQLSGKSETVYEL